MTDFNHASLLTMLVQRLMQVLLCISWITIIFHSMYIKLYVHHSSVCVCNKYKWQYQLMKLYFPESACCLHQYTDAGQVVGNGSVFWLLSRQSWIGCGINIRAVSEVVSYVSDRLEFHHLVSEPSNVRMETKWGWLDGEQQGKLPRKMDGESDCREAERVERGKKDVRMTEIIV